MERIAIIENNLVINIIKGDSNFASNYNGTAIVLTDDEIKIGYSYDGTYFIAPTISSQELETKAREWRDDMLQRTDFIVPLSDYPNHAAWLTYRQELRDWTTTSDFPDTKPVAPAELN